MTQTEKIREVADKADVIVIDTESRADPKEEAYEKVFSATKALMENRRQHSV